MSLFAAFKGVGPSGFGYGTTAEQATEGLDLRGKTYLLTGCNSGIGLETLRVLGLRGGHVIAAARTKAKARQAGVEADVSEITPVACELSDPASVRACVAEVQRSGRALDAIICNAGIMALSRPTRERGYELQLFTNHIGHFILVTGLLDALAAAGRVVMVSSRAHRNTPPGGILFDDLGYERGYKPWKAYGQSKLANILFARELARRLADAGQTAYALHPGVIQTNLGRHMGKAAQVVFGAVKPLFLKTVPQGAATQCYLATRPGLEAASGQYFADCNPARTSAYGADDALAARLWRVSEEIVPGLV
jgi:NAD(P)-dependent dehydrogenase (short-subunit alcohol dehydrogenase family)